ncbi:hypothetical protein KEM48_011422 [Puccinia striiformis f. sp. tritici PST-130]|nr:hypothetical protein KEM48_011422 [Puccinia striiformis f. sp. tritici PST-130]
MKRGLSNGRSRLVSRSCQLIIAKRQNIHFPTQFMNVWMFTGVIQESKGRVIGMGRDMVDIVLTGDQRKGANLSAAMIISILESTPDSPFHSLRLPVGIIWLYAALDFNFTSQKPPGSQKSTEWFDDRVKHHDGEITSRGMKRKFRKSMANLPTMVATWKRALTPGVERSLSDVELKLTEAESPNTFDDNRGGIDIEQDYLMPAKSNDAEVPPSPTRAQRKAFGTHLTMTSRTGFLTIELSAHRW